MKCIYCLHPKTYTLSEGQIKCAKCKRKFSPFKYKRELKIIELFLEGINATKAAKQNDFHFITVKKRYDEIQKKITLYADEQYQKNIHNVSEYDEYLYLPKSIRVFDKNMHKVQNFLTISYNEKVYNILMPNLQKYDYDLNKEKQSKKLSKFLRFNRVAKLQTMPNSIIRFWDFFEDFILKFKGVSDEQFVYYLKEAEFRYNFTLQEQRKILYLLMSICPRAIPPSFGGMLFGIITSGIFCMISSKSTLF